MEPCRLGWSGATRAGGPTATWQGLGRLLQVSLLGQGVEEGASLGQRNPDLFFLGFAPDKTSLASRDKEF